MPELSITTDTLCYNFLQRSVVVAEILALKAQILRCPLTLLVGGNYFTGAITQAKKIKMIRFQHEKTFGWKSLLKISSDLTEFACEGFSEKET